MKNTFPFFRFLISLLPAFVFCGSGSDIGNPDISGFVSYNDGRRAGGAMVVLAREGVIGSVDTSFAKSIGAFTICFTGATFDTAYCNGDGKFTFDSIPPGRYVLVASRNSLLGITTVEHSYYQETEAKISIKDPVQLSIKSYAGQGSEEFLVAHIGGTVYATAADSNGVFSFDALPAGDLELVLYKSDNTFERFKGLTVVAGCSASVIADAARGQDAWVIKDCGYRDPLGRPYILWSSPEQGARGEQVGWSKESLYDVNIQFSHPMDTRKTTGAVSAVSSDSLTRLDTLWWIGADQIFIRLCTLDTLGECMSGSPFRPGVTYSIVIDTTAQSGYGVSVAIPETLTFIP